MDNNTDHALLVAIDNNSIVYISNGDSKKMIHARDMYHRLLHMENIDFKVVACPEHEVQLLKDNANILNNRFNNLINSRGVI